MVFSNSCFVNSCESERATIEDGVEGTNQRGMASNTKVNECGGKRQNNFGATKLFSHQHASIALSVKN